MRLEAETSWVKPLHFGSLEWSGDIQLEDAAGPAGGEAVAWTIQANAAESATFNFSEQGIDLNDYDELVCDLYLEGSDAMPIFTIREWPQPQSLSNWYGKMRRPLQEWIEFRCDLRLDDDGIFLSDRYAAATEFPDGPELTFKLNPQFLRFKGEPSWRRMRVANLRLVRYPLNLDFDKRDTVYGETRSEYTTRYAIQVTSKIEQVGTAVVAATNAADLKFFQAAFDESGEPEIELKLAPGETRTVHLILSIDKHKAEALPALFAESVGLEASMREIPEVTVRPLMGYRDWRLWAAVPAFHTHRPTPGETMAFYREIAKIHPAAKAYGERVMRLGEAALDGDHEVLTYGPGGHSQQYMCQNCQTKTLTAVTHDRHRCRTCGKEYTNDKIVKSYYTIRHGRIIQSAARLAEAYQHSGDERFARAVLDILLDYADKYEDIVSLAPRSTASQSKLSYTTLSEAFLLASHYGTIFDSYHLVATSPSLTEEERKQIEYDFLLNAGTRMMRHGATMNQRVEYYTCFGLAGLYTGRWALAGEAIYGDQGFLSLFDDGFSEDGIALEGGAYHHQTFMGMCRFATIMNRQGVNLYSKRFKNVFDGSIARSPLGIYPSGHVYEAAYQMYRDPAYLPTLRRTRNKPGETTFREGVIGLPDGPAYLNTLSNLKGTGYLYLRRNAPRGHRCLAINYGMQWERKELDRLHFQLFADGKPISSQVGRITYGSPYSANMYPSFAHNLVTVDGQNLVEERVPLVEVVERDSLAAALFQVDDDKPLYSGVRQWKLVAIVGDHFVVIDRLESDTPRLYAWHHYPVADKQTLKLTMTATDDPPALYEKSLRDGSVGECRLGTLGAEPLFVEFAPANGLTMLAPEGAEVLDGQIMAGYRPRMTPFLRVAKTAPMAEFAVIHRTGEDADATIEKIDSPTNTHVWEVVVAGKTYLLGVNLTGQTVDVAGKGFKTALIAQELQPHRDPL